LFFISRFSFFAYLFIPDLIAGADLSELSGVSWLVMIFICFLITPCLLAMTLIFVRHERGISKLTTQHGTSVVHE
jgi:hypothetical protein